MTDTTTATACYACDWGLRSHQHTCERGAPRCGHEISDGNPDDASYAYCGLARGHAGDHGAWER